MLSGICHGENHQKGAIKGEVLVTGKVDNARSPMISRMLAGRSSVIEDTLTQSAQQLVHVVAIVLLWVSRPWPDDKQKEVVCNLSLMGA